MITFAIAVYGLVWGSFLNVVAFRLVHDRQFFTSRSLCAYCDQVIAWYDNVPVLSYVALGARCRSCRGTISVLYPLIELLSALLFVLLWLTSTSWSHFAVYSVVLSAFIIAIRTDLEAMVIPQLCTLWLIPVGLLCAWAGLLPISWWESVAGATLGFGGLWLVAWCFKRIMGKDGLGMGDVELLGMIGAFFGPVGVWLSLTVGSLLGLFIGGIYVVCTKQGRNARIPFGPFLIVGALLMLYTPTIFNIVQPCLPYTN